MQEIFGPEFDYEKIRARRKELMNAHIKEHGIEKKTGVDELLGYLHKKGIRTAIATATDEVRAKEYLEKIGIYGMFDRVICATMVENGKPKPDIYRYACEQMKEHPADCIAVEDSPNGIRSAYDAGLRVVMVPDLTGPDETVKDLITAEVPVLSDMIDLIEREKL